MPRLVELAAVALVSLLSISLPSFVPPMARALPYEGTLEIAAGSLPPFVVSESGDGVSTAAALQIGPGAGFTTTAFFPITNTTPGGNVTLPAFPVVELALTGPAGLTDASFAAGAGPDGGFGGDAGLRSAGSSPPGCSPPSAAAGRRARRW